MFGFVGVCVLDLMISSEAVELAAERERGRDAQSRKVVAEKLERPAVRVADADDVIARFAVREECCGFSCHAGAEHPRQLATLEIGELLLDGANRGVKAIPRVQVALRAAFDDVEDGLGRRKAERGVVVERRMNAAIGIERVSPE